jgi:ABC-2 type transport system permease protein
VCVGNLGISAGPATVLRIIGMVVGGGFIFGAMFLLITAPMFIMTRANSLGGIMFIFRESSWYPLSILPRFIQIIMTVILPFGMVNFFPVQPLLGKQDFLMFGPYMVWLAPVFAVVFFCLAVCFFNVCLKQYKSTGS